VQDLAVCWRRWARRSKARTSTIRIQGVSRLHGTEHTIIPDRIEAGTFMIAAAITAGDLRIRDCVLEHVHALTLRLRQAGRK